MSAMKTAKYGQAMAWHVIEAMASISWRISKASANGIEYQYRNKRRNGNISGGAGIKAKWQ
jgi:hypothetical protein